MRTKNSFSEFWFVFCVILLFWCARLAHGATTSGKHNNSLGVVQYDVNPLTYKAGAVNVSGVIDDSINFRLQPLGTYGLFTEDILLCDKKSLAEKFEGKSNPLLLTYKTRASRVVRGVGCHELIRVDELPSPEVK